MLDIPTLDLSALPSLPLSDYRSLPPLSAIYVCFHEDGSILYIGSSWHIRRRWCNHHLHRRLRTYVGVRIGWFVCDIASLDELELALISQYLPPLNRHKKRARLPQNKVQLVASQCAHCQVTIYRRPSTLRHSKHVYCSAHCNNAARRGWKSAVFVERCCGYCRQTFSILASVVRQGGGLFCSRQCSSRANAPDVLDHFWHRVLRCSHAPECLYCCWLWQGPLVNGYGRFWVWSKKQSAHVFSWELHNQRQFLSQNHTYVIRHLCANRACVNPWHLMHGTHQENHHDWRMLKRLRLISRKS